jgi:hypothetical protein
MVWVNDTQLGFSQMVSLAVGECTSFELADMVQMPIYASVDSIIMPDLYCNIVDVEYFYCHAWYYEYAEDCVFIAMPDIEVSKVPYCPAGFVIDEMMLGHGFYWNITVTNTGNVPLGSVWVNDTQLGFSQEISLGVGETWSVEIDDMVMVLPIDDIYCNEVVVQYFYCHAWFEEADESCVLIVDPEITVVKQALCLAGYTIEEMLLGHPMIWNITVTNTGNVPLVGIWVNDSMLYISEQVSLMPGESAYWDVMYQPIVNDFCDPWTICNEVVVQYFYCHAWFTTSANDCIFVVNPDADVVKVALHDFGGDIQTSTDKACSFTGGACSRADD